jgi:uncharacterized protein (TIGR02001 family)
MTQVAAGLALGLVASTASAEWSYNVGFASEYYYRGILQKESSASAGIDFEESGFYLGAWTADVGDGLEVDGYGGWGFETENGFSASIGFTGYYYTGEVDDSYEVVNLNLGFGIASLEYSVGEWDGFGDEADFDFLAVTLDLSDAIDGLYATFGTFGDEFDGEYFELGWGTTISEIDFGIAGIFSSDELSDQSSSGGSPTESEAIVFTISKTW